MPPNTRQQIADARKRIFKIIHDMFVQLPKVILLGDFNEEKGRIVNLLEALGADRLRTGPT